MTEIKERVRVLRQVEHGVLSKVENANGVVTLLKELTRDNDTSVAVAAAHCLRRVFSQLLDPAKNPQLPCPRDNDDDLGEDTSANNSGRKKKTKRQRVEGDGDGSRVGKGADKAASVYQKWLEARFFDYLRILLGWVAEVDDFNRQGPALRTLMQFVEIEPKLCVSTVPKGGRFTGTLGGVSTRGSGEGANAGVGAGDGTLWSGLFFEIVRAMALGPCSMQPKLLEVLGEDYVNVHDDVRYFLLGNITAMARRAIADDENRSQGDGGGGGDSYSANPAALPIDSPLRGFPGVEAAFVRQETVAISNGDNDGDMTMSARKRQKDRKKKKAVAAGTDRDSLGGSVGSGGYPQDGRGGAGQGHSNGTIAAVSSSASAASTSRDKGGIGEKPQEDDVDDGQETAGTMSLAQVGGRLAQLLMVVRMVEEQSDLTAFLLPVKLSLVRTSSTLTSPKSRNVGDDGDVSSSSDDSDEDSEEQDESTAGVKGKRKVGGGVGAGTKNRKQAGERKSGKGSPGMLAIERLRYHKKVFGDAWLACLRLPLPPALYRRVLLFLPGNVITYMPSPVRLADFLTEAYGLGGVQSVLALDALFLLMQAYDLDYPNFYDSLYRLVTPTMMYAKHRARFFRMVDLCLSSSHVPAYVVAAFLKKFARTTLQAPPSGALFTLALTRKLIGRHPECVRLISVPPKDTKRDYLNPGASKAGVGKTGGGTLHKGGGVAGSVVDEFDEDAQSSKDAGALKTSLWELAALQNHYHPSVSTLARGFLREADKKEVEGEVFQAPSKLATESYQSLFDQEMRRKTGSVALAFRRPKGIFDDIPEEGGGIFAATNFAL